MARILIAEDSPDIRALIQMLLETAGHDIVTVSDGRAAVRAVRETKPDLILMDLSLPVLSGWEATRQIRSDPAGVGIPILAVTAHAMQGDRERALAAGCDGFIPKPINEETFAARVAAFLGIRPPVSAASPGRQDLPAGEPGRILVVDDQPDIASLLRNDLAAEGHDIVVAHSADDALRALEGGDHFDLAVVDVMLGSESGYSLTRTLTGRSSEYLPVLLVTAGTIDRERGYAMGADDFIGKPIEVVELRARARSLVRVGRLVREQRRLGKERSEAYRKLAELDQLRSGFLSTVSHELRTPLNTIILLAHQLEKASSGTAPASRASHDVRVLRDAAEALRRMIDNILDLAKLEAGQRDLQPGSVCLAELLRETAELLEPQARQKGLGLTVEADPALPAAAYLDREKVSRVLVNLLSNAVKYTESGGAVLRARPWQDSISFEVEDTGVGIPPELVASAFEPFRQIRTGGEASRGTGLGLTISKQLVELMGGDLFLESNPGGGTRVSFTLPQLPGVAEISTPSESAADPQAHGQSLVLIVEDDAASRYGLGALLGSEGYQIEEASSLAEADRALKDQTPDAIILDITLPDGDGAAWLAGRVKAAAQFPPVIALTGVTADEDTRRIERSGVVKVLTKPVNVTQLLLVLRETCAGTRKPG